MKRFGPGALATPANFITLGRLLFAVPTLLLIERDGATWLTVSLWFVLCITDGIDGWLARRDGTTRSGAFLDPLADKVLVLGGFIALAINGDFGWIPVGIVAVREIFISGYRILEGRRGVSLPSRRLGKWKANVQFLAVALVLFPPTADNPDVHDVALWTAVAFSVVSAVDLVWTAYREYEYAR